MHIHLFDSRHENTVRDLIAGRCVHPIPCLDCGNLVTGPELGAEPPKRDNTNINKHRLVGWLNDKANSLRIGTVHVWDGSQFVCWGFSESTGWVVR
jgi:hypothetical protein